MLATRLLVLFLFAMPAVAVQVAPLPPQIAPMFTDDVMADAETNGESTLVVWTAEFSPYRQSHSIGVRLLDSDHDRLGIRIASGYAPHVATNGTEYGIAYAIGVSRFWSGPYDNVGFTIVNADGTRGATRKINRSLSGAAGGIAWNGAQWIVSFTSEEGARVAIIEPDLSMRVVAIGGGTAGEVRSIAGSTWVVLEGGGAPSELVEIHADGSVGQRQTVPGTGVRVIPTAAGALVFMQAADGIHVATLNAAGVGPFRLVAGDMRLQDAEPWKGVALVLMTPANGSAAVGLIVGLEGNPIDSRILVTAPVSSRTLQLGRSRDGVVLLYSRPTPPSEVCCLDLYLWPLSTLAPVDLENGLLVSAENIARQALGRLAAAGDHVLVVWSQTSSTDGTFSTFSRMFDAYSRPLNEPVQLPLTLSAPPALLFDGGKFLISWADERSTIQVATLSADGTTLGTAFSIGPGSAPVLGRSGSNFFLAWKALDQQVWGTPLRADGSPVVPSGFPILPTLTGGQSPPRIAAHPLGFHLLWSDQNGVVSVIVSPAGTPLALTELAQSPADSLALASSTNSALAAWVTTAADHAPTLYAFSADRPFELFDPHWGDTWFPIEVTPIGPDAYLVVIVRDGVLLMSEVTMTGAYITGITPLVPLAPVDDLSSSVARVGERTLVLRSIGRELHFTSDVPVKRRATGRR